MTGAIRTRRFEPRTHLGKLSSTAHVVYAKMPDVARSVFDQDSRAFAAPMHIAI